jgi:hypothetical protein
MMQQDVVNFCFNLCHTLCENFRGQTTQYCNMKRLSNDITGYEDECRCTSLLWGTARARGGSCGTFFARLCRSMEAVPSTSTWRGRECVCVCVCVSDRGNERGEAYGGKKANRTEQKQTIIIVLTYAVAWQGMPRHDITGCSVQDPQGPPVYPLSVPFVL